MYGGVSAWNRNENVRFEVLTASMKIAASKDVAPYSLVDTGLAFQRICYCC
jgi:hypothetical protein